jgi:hypothetical protein
MGQARRNGRRVLAGCGRASKPGASAGRLFIMGDDIGFMQPHITHSAIIWANWDKRGFSDEGDCDD